MSGEPAESMNLRPHHNIFPEHVHYFRPVDHLSSEGPFRLEAHKHDAAFLAPEVVFEMMPHPASLTHSRTCDYNRLLLDRVQNNGVFHLASKMYPDGVPAFRTEKSLRLFIKILLMSFVDPGNSFSKGTVDIYIYSKQPVFFDELVQDKK